ncbi:hypothetical protein CCP3SC15_4570003 [Gammaproteobacteria bacterium]
MRTCGGLIDPDQNPIRVAVAGTDDSGQIAFEDHEILLFGGDIASLFLRRN